MTMEIKFLCLSIVLLTGQIQAGIFDQMDLFNSLHHHYNKDLHSLHHSTLSQPGLSPLTYNGAASKPVNMWTSNSLADPPLYSNPANSMLVRTNNRMSGTQPSNDYNVNHKIGDQGSVAPNPYRNNPMSESNQTPAPKYNTPNVEGVKDRTQKPVVNKVTPALVAVPKSKLYFQAQAVMPENEIANRTEIVYYIAN